MAERRAAPAELVSALFEEYRVLYGLADFRMRALDRRVPVAGGVLAAFLGGLTALPENAQVMVLLGMPIAVVWFMRTTVNHARSFEDVLRRIEEIEREVNGLLGRNVLRFQSLHPSRRLEVGGRTGRETTGATLWTSMLLLAACAFQYWETMPDSDARWTAYVCYLALAGMTAAWERLRLKRYAYEPRPELERPE